MIVIASVPHCGSHFTNALLTSCGVKYYSRHTYPTDMDQLLLGDDFIVPMRHPIGVAMSWKMRGKDPNDAMPFWGRLIYQIAPFLPYYLPLDLPDREAWLHVLNEGMDLELVTDWETVRGAEPRNQDAKLEAGEIVRVEKLLKDYAGFFAQFGYRL